MFWYIRLFHLFTFFMLLVRLRSTFICQHDVLCYWCTCYPMLKRQIRYVLLWIRLCTYYYVIIIRLLFVMLIIGIKIYVFQSHDSLTYRFLYLKLGATRTDWVVSACP